MKLLVILIIILNVAFAGVNETPDGCDANFPIKNKSNVDDINKALQMASIPSYYLYLETKELEDLQEFKNCVDYLMCGKYQESIVDDSKNYRMHIWKAMTENDLNTLLKSCPVTDLNKKLVVRLGDQKGKLVDVKKTKPDGLLQTILKKNASPAMFHTPSAEVAKATVSAVQTYLKMGKTEEAHKLILFTWGIDLHGYKLTSTGEKGSFAVTNHQKKTISYGTDWLTEPCDYIRMIRHEAEHVAQMKMATLCEDHNLEDHKKRERAAHLNDARFIQTVCPNSKTGDSIRNFCLERFRKNYMNVNH